MKETLDDSALDLLFRDARMRNAWHDEPVPDTLLSEMWDLDKLGPTSTNLSPAQVVFVVSAEAKEKLTPGLIEANVDKIMSSSATAIIGYDMTFYDKLPELLPHKNTRAWLAGNEELIADTAFFSATQAYSNFLCNLGYSADESVSPSNPRLTFDDACKVV